MDKRAEEFFQTEVKVFEDLQRQMKTLVSKRRQLESQMHENQIVHEQFVKLTAEHKIYKLIGPVLIPQTLPDAKSNVEKRMEYIRTEITRVERSLQETSAKEEKKKTELMALQAKLQAQMQEFESAQQQQVSA